jgi:2-phosphosulfolactate phosphatase
LGDELVRVFGQARYRARFEWGLTGAEAIAPDAAFVVVVDVLSFTTALSVAVEHGMAVMPYPWRDGSAVEAAARFDAECAVGRSAAGPDEISLSPAVIRRVASRRRIERLVLPSPNGSTISSRFAAAGGSGPMTASDLRFAADGGSGLMAADDPRFTVADGSRFAVADGSRPTAPTVIGVGLRNAAAAAEWVRARLAGRPGAVVAAGERWADGGLRPAVEDLWGAGAFLNTFDDLSPEAEMAVAAYRAVADRMPDALAASSSGRELEAMGFADDVAVAAEVNSTEVVPELREGWFRNAR